MASPDGYPDGLLPRVLFVDDEPGVRAAFARSMSARGFLVDLAADGHEAVAMASRHLYSVIATDLSMPGLDGFSMIEELRSLAPGTVFVVVTGQSLADVTPVRTSDGSISRIISKPWDSDDLADALRRAFQTHDDRCRTETQVPRILLIDGDADSATAVWNALEHGGGHRFMVETVSSLEDAEASLQGTRYQAVVTELDVPDVSGVEYLRRLQGIAEDVPIVVLTGDPDLIPAREAIRLGAQDFISKRELGMVPLDRSIQFAIERKRSERRLAHLANHDQLTGLSNRGLFQTKVGQAMGRSRRRQEPFALVMVDIDRFKSINDGLGQEGGDAVLVEMARRLLAHVESPDTVARIGADEFAFLVESAPSPSACARLAQQILDVTSEPIVLGGAELAATASIGIALYPDNGESVADLLTSAETALLQAKQAGRESYRLFGDRMQSDALVQLQLEGSLRRALERQEFRLHYQPQYELDHGTLVGVEALLRWEREGELVPPGKFIPALEDTGLIVPVGAWVLHQACRDLTKIHKIYGNHVRMAVNLSARQFERDGLVDVVFDALDQQGLTYGCLELEITESLLMRDVSRTVAILASLKEAGARVAIDDFGTGYSSLAYLRRFPVDVLKVDRMFVNEIGTEGPSMTHAIISLGQTLGLEMVAEGVENATQLMRLRDEGCDVVQGFFCARPAALDTSRQWNALPMSEYLSLAGGEEAKASRSPRSPGA